MGDRPRILHDKGTDRPILMSPGRLSRPHTTGADEGSTEDCPFCAGNEHMTPPESEAVRADGSSPDSPGWSARAFPNLFPAIEHHEVIAEGSDHTIHPAELRTQVLIDSLALHRRRIAALEALDGVACAFLFKNVGVRAGSSIAHNHSQLLGLPMLPPRLVDELAACREHGCIHCAEIESAAAEDRIVYQGQHHIILCPSTPKLPFETWLLPLDHRDPFLTTTNDEDVAAALHELFDAANRSFSRGDFNSFLHRVPGEDFHWHIELQPRAGQVAALEIGGDMYINAITPQMSAARLRAD